MCHKIGFVEGGLGRTCALIVAVVLTDVEGVEDAENSGGLAGARGALDQREAWRWRCEEVGEEVVVVREGERRRGRE